MAFAMAVGNGWRNVSKSALGRYIRQVNKLDVRRGKDKDTERQKKGT